MAKKQGSNQNSFAKSSEASRQESGDRDQSAKGLEASATNQNPRDYQLQTETNVYKSQNNMQVDPGALSRSAKNDNVPSLD